MSTLGGMGGRNCKIVIFMAGSSGGGGESCFSADIRTKTKLLSLFFLSRLASVVGKALFLLKRKKYCFAMCRTAAQWLEFTHKSVHTPPSSSELSQQPPKAAWNTLAIDVNELINFKSLKTHFVKNFYVFCRKFERRSCLCWYYFLGLVRKIVERVEISDADWCSAHLNNFQFSFDFALNSWRRKEKKKINVLNYR